MELVVGNLSKFIKYSGKCFEFQEVQHCERPLYILFEKCSKSCPGPIFFYNV